MRQTCVARTRLSVVIGVTVLAAACSGSDHRSAPASTSARSTPEVTTPLGSGPAGYIEGSMHAVGGTVPGADAPLAGEVEIVRPGKTTVLTRVVVNRTGRFRVLLPEGEYEVVGHLNNGLTLRSAAVSVIRGRAVTVDLIEQVT